VQIEAPEEVVEAILEQIAQAEAADA